MQIPLIILRKRIQTMLARRCPIWHTPARVGEFLEGKDSYHIDSPRVNGYYDVFRSTSLDSVYNLKDSDKALLTTWLIEQRSDGVTIPEFGTWFNTLIHEQEAMSDEQRYDHLLYYMKRCCPDIGDHFQFRVDPAPVFNCPDWIRYVEMLAFSQSWKPTQIEYLIDFLVDEGFLKRHHGICPPRFCLSITRKGNDVLSLSARASD